MGTTDIMIDRRVARAGALRDRVGESRQRAVLDRWIARATAGPVTRRDLAPEMFGLALNHVDLVEVLDDDYRHLIEGREVTRRFGQSGETPFSGLYETGYLKRLRAFYDTVQMTGTPNLRHFAVDSMTGEEMAFSQLVLPGMDADGRVSHLAVVFDFPDPVRCIPTAPLRIHSAWRRLDRGTERAMVPGDRMWR